MDVVSLGFETDLMLRRLAGSTIIDHGDHLVIRTPQNPGYYWGNFVLAGADLGNAARWTAVFAAEFPQAEHVAIGLDTAQPHESILAAYRAAGLSTDVSTVLTASALTQPPPSPPGVTIRELASDNDWALSLQLRYSLDEDDSAAHREFGARRVIEKRQLAASGHGHWFGAFVDGQLRSQLGIVHDGGAGPARFQDVETHPDWRRRGLARALVHSAGHYALTQLRARTLVIVADPDYHAIALYRGLGFAAAESQAEIQHAP